VYVGFSLEVVIKFFTTERVATVPIKDPSKLTYFQFLDY